MTTFNRTYRSPKFFLCTHVTEEDYLGFESSENRFSYFTFLCYGKGKVYAFDGDDVEIIDSTKPKTLINVSRIINYSVVGQAKANTKIISFNSWKKDNKWDGRLINENMVRSDRDYACLVCLEGSVIVNGNEINEMQYANLVKGKEYPINIPKNSYVGLFELCQ